VVSLPDKEMDPQANVTDMGFNQADTEVRAMVYIDGTLYLLDRLTSGGSFKVDAGTAAGGPWHQIGLGLVETPSSLWADKSFVYVLVNEVTGVGTGCRKLPLAAGPAEPWQACEQFPEFNKDGAEDPYSTFAKLMGRGEEIVAWFEVKGMEDPGLSLHRLKDGSWPLAAEAVAAKPTAWGFDGARALFGYVGSDAPGTLFGMSLDGGSGVVPSSGIPFPPKDKWSGVVGICPLESGLYLLYLDYGVGTSKLFVYKG
jgi:hypothetical protein